MAKPGLATATNEVNGDTMWNRSARASSAGTEEARARASFTGSTSRIPDSHWATSPAVASAWIDVPRTNESGAVCTISWNRPCPLGSSPVSDALMQ